METKVCKVCGRELTLDHFAKNNYGVSHTCKECKGKRISEGHLRRNKVAELEEELKAARQARLKDFTPRELMLELKTRGYVGKLEYVETHIVDLKTL